MVQKKPTTLRSRVAERFRHEDEPDVKKVDDGNDATVKGARVPKTEEMATTQPAPVYSVGAGAPPAEQKKLQATIEADRKALKKKQV